MSFKLIDKQVDILNVHVGLQKTARQQFALQGLFQKSTKPWSLLFAAPCIIERVNISFVTGVIERFSC